MERVCVVGLGYVGLPTAIMLAQHGFEVIGYDIDEQKVSRINGGCAGIEEPGLNQRLQEVLANKSFYATTHLTTAHYFIIAVPTPITPDKKADLSFVYDAISAIAQVVQPHNTVIVESTISIGTTETIAAMLVRSTGLTVGESLFVAHCPERVWPSNMIQEIINNDRIIGGITPTCTARAEVLYKSFVRGKLIAKNARFAEFLKLIENSSIDVAVAWAHQVAWLAEQLSFDPYEVVAVANCHPRVKIATPTCGVGGHCVAVDPWFLIETFEKSTPLLQAARFVNDQRPNQIIAAVRRHVEQWCLKHEKQICCVQLLGLTYKANVDDLRESPALKVAQELMQDPRIRLLVTEPYANRVQLRTLFGDRICSFYDGFSQADIVVGLVAHRPFKELDVQSFGHKIMLDFAGLGWQQTMADGAQRLGYAQQRDVASL